MTPSSNDIHRREAIRRVALLLGGTLSAPTIAAVLAGCEAPRATATGWTPRALSADQGELVATIAEQILPETDTPGARSAGVHQFIDTMLAEYYSPAERARFLEGLDDVDARARKATGKRYLQSTKAEQHAVLMALDREAYSHTPTRVATPESQQGATENAAAAQRRPDSGSAVAAPAQRPVPFFRTMKEITLLGYYTSQPGATRELQHNPVPGRFEGCVPLSKVGRAWAV
jgi:hypothetical protein